MSNLKLFLFGPPRVELNGFAVEMKRRKAMAMLIYVVVRRQPHSRDALAALFYPEHDQSRARAYLRRDLAVLNTALVDDWLDADRDTVTFKPQAGFWSDIDQFSRVIDDWRNHPHTPSDICNECMTQLTTAVSLYHDDFLTGFTLSDCPEFDEWQFFETESLRQALAAALERLVQGLSDRQAYATAIPHARRRVALDPLHEPAQRALIQVYDWADQPSAALRQYEELTALLENELGLPPSEETMTLYEAVKAKRLLSPYLKVKKAQPDPPAARQPLFADTPAVLEVADAPPPVRPPQTEPDTPTPALNPPAASVSTPDFVAREPELAHLHSWLDQALHGARQLVFVTGEPGMGKTTVIDRLLAEVQPQPELWVGRGQCIEHRGQGEAYMPVLEALGRMGRADNGAELIALLARLAPTWLVQLPWLISDEQLQSLQPKIMAATRDRMLREMVEAIETLTGRHPLILVLEDLQWSDYSTLDLLAYLGRRQEPARLLIIGTYRPSDALRRDHPLQAVVQELQLHGLSFELPLPQLTEPEIDAYLSRRLPGSELPADLARHLHHRTGGNPLFVRTVVDGWLAQGLLSPAGQADNRPANLAELVSRVPDNLRHLIEQQVQRLDSIDQTILDVACVAGMRFAAAALLPALDLSEDAIEARCTALARANQFIRDDELAEWPNGAISAQYNFAHHLYQEVLYNRLPAGRRVRLHRQIGEQLEAGYGTETQEIAAELALHFVRGRDPGRAVKYLRLAAEHALTRNAHREAVEHLSQGLEILAAHPQLPDHNKHELALQAVLGPVLVTIRGWSDPDVEYAYVRACELSERMGDMEQFSLVLYGLATLYELRGEYTRSEALLKERLRLPLDTHKPRLLIESHELLACSLFHQGRYTQSLDHAQRGSNLYDAKEHLALIAFLAENPGVACFHWAGLDLWFLGYPDQALEQIGQSLTLAHETSHAFSLAQAHARAAMLSHLRREVAQVQHHAEATITVAMERSFLYWEGLGHIFRGWAVAAQGQFDQGIAELRRGIEMCRSTGAKLEEAYFLALLAEAYGQADQIEAGLEAIAAALTLVRNSRTFYYEPELFRLKGMLLLQSPAETNEDAAETNFRQAIELAQRQQAKLLELRAAVSLARLWTEQNNQANVRPLLTPLLTWFTEGFDTVDFQAAKSFLAAVDGEELE